MSSGSFAIYTDTSLDASQLSFYSFSRQRRAGRSVTAGNKDFKFDVPAHGAITFKITFEPGVLPEVFPDARKRKSRKSVGEAPAPLDNTVGEAKEDGLHEDATAETTGNDDHDEMEVGEGYEAFIPAAEPATMVIAYHVTGERRKELVRAISQITGLPAAYQNAPTFAFAIGNYTVDKSGTLVGERNSALVGALAEQGFIAE